MIDFKDARRGDIWLVDDVLGSRDPGSTIIRGTRPVVVVSTNLNNCGDTVTVIPMTGNMLRESNLFAVKVQQEAAKGIVLTSQITTVDRIHLVKWLGVVDPDNMAQITLRLAEYLS